MTKTKTAIAIAILMFSMAFSLVALPTNAQPGVSRKTYAYVDAIPNPVGVGDECLIRFGIFQQTPNVAFGYSGLTVTMVKPDGTTQTLGPFMTDSTGSGYTLHTFSELGTYKLTANFPEQIWTFGDFFNLEGGNMIFNGTTMAASTSFTIDLVVQQESVATYPGHALPSEYWTRPIDPQLREWYQVSGNWPYRPDNSLALYNDDAPETAHVLWSKPLTTGGLTGGLWEGDIPANSETGDAYEGKFPGSVVLNGILYYQRTDTRMEMAPAIIGIDLHTGEDVFFKNNTLLSFGQVFYFNSWNYDGVYTYLVEVRGSTYNFYDPFTGNWQYSFLYVPSGSRSFGPSGEILIYQIDTVNNWLALWNSSAAGHSHLGAMGPDYGSWGNSVHGRTIAANVSRAYSWNVTIPAGITYGTSFFAPVMKIYPNDRVMSAWWNYTHVRTWALSVKDLTSTSTSTTLLFDKWWTAPAEWLTGLNTIQYASATNQVEKGVFSLWNKELRKHYGFSVETGNYMWETDSEQFLDFLGWGNAEHTWYFAYGKYFSTGVGGILYAYDDQTGDTVWTYDLTDAYGEPVTGDRWWGWIDLITDGKVYVGHLEHSAEQPMPRGAPFACINASNGAEIWRVNGMYRQTRWGGCGVIGDSIIATMDTYDQQVWAVGKGPSETTVMASPKVSAFTSSVLIEGYVTDTSPGTEDYARTARFPNGVPAVSDESQSEWMLYVYKQFERPMDATGVDVSIDVLDANGNFRNIGTAKSDANGFYSFQWCPDIPGKFTVYASFVGSKAYYPSNAETAFIVDPAPEATPEPTQPPASLADQYLLPATGGIIAAIAVVGVVLALLLRKK
jgi:hypothetical protein